MMHRTGNWALDCQRRSTIISCTILSQWNAFQFSHSIKISFYVGSFRITITNGVYPTVSKHISVTWYDWLFPSLFCLGYKYNIGTTSIVEKLISGSQESATAKYSMSPQTHHLFTSIGFNIILLTHRSFKYLSHFSYQD